MAEVFLKNCWYLAAWADELAPGAKLGRQIAGEHVLLLRDDAGQLAALQDSCPHRFAPLSMGAWADGQVTCPYHGLRFAVDGRCVHNPHGAITAALAVPAYAVVERHAALWLWLGEQPADPALVPDLSFIDETPPQSRAMGYLPSAADYRLMVDNIMDLTHADYLHADTLGGGINSRARADVVQDGDRVTITWTARDDELPPLMVKQVDTADGRGDFRNRVHWYAPGTMLLQLRVAQPGALEIGGHDATSAHVMTPECAGRTHYFYCSTSDEMIANPALTPIIAEILGKAFAGEDKPMLEAQTARIAGRDFWALRPAMLPSDKGAVLARRTLDRLLAAEAGG
ncbi:Rieske 2Fe-2S domain-containing protein [Altererythrobacter buctensis]|uniref:Rieske 2Fe-2S domain-containing protein n=1 Tax=Alteraurantiacibacter buctensis TaxID=1503981 RepID=A0A844YXQ0_9SPHN|nr:aromatic ring-hydroxylating dioxygenase subunit alpha [Alteraurantiacibacter buctensis]MXO71952.1 Rieske 2Fe-2S domain-containing protein [Alteraurantiacibacter buctensis]